jgi:SAM-dependent methyltransferase
VVDERVTSLTAVDDARARGRAWREWFEGWLNEPLTKRSTGTGTLPEEYFTSAAAFVVSTLRLDASTDQVLDVGCDSAMISRRVAPHCRRFVGVDFIPGMLCDAQRAGGHPSLNMAAADGRQLPFRSHAFDKVYCSAVIHTLPSIGDGEALVDELIRVCRPGGEVLVASVPDIRKRRSSQRLIWRRASLSQRLAMIASWALPPAIRHPLKRAAGRPSIDPMRYLEYDLAALARRLTGRGLVAEVVDFPDTYWSVDFRTSRSNLHITLPAPAGWTSP